MNLTENIIITKAIARATQWRTVNVDDHDSDVVTGEHGLPQLSTSYAAVTIQVCGANLKDANGVAIPWSNTYKKYVLTVFDDIPSSVLRRNLAPKDEHDEFTVVPLLVPGLYTAIMTAYNANVSGSGKTRKRCLAVDAIGFSSQLLGPEFAGA